MLRHQDQSYAVPESAYVAPLYSVGAAELTADLKTFYNVRMVDKTPRLIAPPAATDEDNVEDLDDVDEESLWQYGVAAGSAVLGLLVMAVVFVYFNRKPVAAVVAAEPPRPPLKMVVTDAVLGYGSCGTVV